jgi:hypothetical protein
MMDDDILCVCASKMRLTLFMLSKNKEMKKEPIPKLG